MYKFLQRDNYSYDFGRMPGMGLIDDAFISITKFNKNGFDSQLTMILEGNDLIIEIPVSNNINQILLDKKCLLYNELLPLVEQNFYSKHHEYSTAVKNPNNRSDDNKNIILYCGQENGNIVLRITNNSDERDAVRFNLGENEKALSSDYKLRLRRVFRDCYKRINEFNKEIEMETAYQRS